jgi:predicted DNA-binding WGR domain protein
LDVGGEHAQNWVMSEEMIQFLVLDRRDPSCNMARFYVLAIEPNLFESLTLIREWGRIGRRGQRRVEIHDNWMMAAEELDTWLRRKVQRSLLSTKA